MTDSPPRARSGPLPPWATTRLPGGTTGAAESNVNATRRHRDIWSTSFFGQLHYCLQNPSVYPKRVTHTSSVRPDSTVRTI